MLADDVCADSVSLSVDEAKVTVKFGQMLIHKAFKGGWLYSFLWICTSYELRVMVLWGHVFTL